MVIYNMYLVPSRLLAINNSIMGDMEDDGNKRPALVSAGLV